LRHRLTLFLCLVLAHPVLAQKPRLKTDVLGLPPLPGAKTIGSIRLPLADILKPEPGQTPTGPKLTDLAILTYRVPTTTSRDSLAAFYRKYAPQFGWRLLDEISDSSTNRSLVFYSKSAPGYLTVDVVPGPDDTIQIDLTRLLGEVDPSRPGEVYKLTGKRVRFQRVSATIAGRFLDLKTNKVVQATVSLIESASENGLPVDAAKRLAPIDETYAAVIVVRDSLAQMSKVEVFSGNNAKLAVAENRYAGGDVTLTARVRASQGLNLRVNISGPDPLTTAVAGATPPRATGTPAPTKTAAPAKPAAKPAVKPAPKPALPPGTKPLPAGVPIVSLVEWNLRPPLTALPEARRASSTTRTETVTVAKDVELGSTCDGPVNLELPWRTSTTETFDFPADFFGNGITRTPTGERTGVLNIQFPARSGLSNSYTLTQSVTTTTTAVDLGYSFQTQWIKMPGEKKNPESRTYVVVSQSQPTVSKKTSGSCYQPPAPAGNASPAPAAQG
jgi:hypothetical protein